MSVGTISSGVGHAALILWVVLGDWLFAPAPAPEIAVAQVSLVSSAQFDALVAAAPVQPDPLPEPAPPPEAAAPAPVVPEVVVPEPPPEPAPEPVALPEPVPELTPEVPVSPDPQPVPAPEPVAPIAADEQPIPVPLSDKKPKPRAIDRVAATPVDESVDAPEIADTVTPEVSDEAQTAEVVEDPAPAAAPEEATTQIVTEAVETEPDAPQLAMTSSRRPQSRPERTAEVPPEDPAPAPVETPAETADPEADAIAAALAEATAETPSEDTGASDAPTGPPMTGGEIDAMRVAVKQCWNLGSLSSDAMRTTVTVQLSLAADGVPDIGSIRLISSDGGTDASAKIMFTAARSAIARCGRAGFPLPPEKYDQWKDLELVFDPNGMRLR